MLGFLRDYLGWALNSMPQKYQCLLIFLSQYCVQKYLVCISPKSDKRKILKDTRSQWIIENFLVRQENVEGKCKSCQSWRINLKYYYVC